MPRTGREQSPSRRRAIAQNGSRAKYKRHKRLTPHPKVVMMMMRRARTKVVMMSLMMILAAVGHPEAWAGRCSASAAATAPRQPHQKQNQTMTTTILEEAAS